MASKAKTAAPAAKAAAPSKSAKPAAAAGKAGSVRLPATAAARPLVSVRKADAADSIVEQISAPHVFIAPIRPDIVHFVHTSMAKNKRQAYAVSAGAGHQHSAESWGTGRAVARIPRVSGGGTSRAGQAAFGNMCRAGRMFAPTKIWRKWHRKINTNQKRFAVASALAATALPSLVLARGHRVENVPEIPLVVDGIEGIQRTKQAIHTLKVVGGYADVLKAKESKKLRRGKGKLRNRRHTNRRGPLVVFNEDNGIVRAFRNLPGVEVAQVDSLNLLQLAPGGHLGRFVIWTKSAFQKLNNNWGSFTRPSVQKRGYHLPRPLMVQSDLTRLINSDEIQSKVRAPIKTIVRAPLKKNPLTNLGARVKLNPYALAARRSELLAAERRAKGKVSKLQAVRAKNIASAAKSHNAVNKAANIERILDDSHQAKINGGRKAAAAAKKPAKAAASPAKAAAAPKKK